MGLGAEARLIFGFCGAVAFRAGSPNGWRGRRILLAAVGRSRSAGPSGGRMRAATVMPPSSVAAPGIVVPDRARRSR